MSGSRAMMAAISVSMAPCLSDRWFFGVRLIVSVANRVSFLLPLTSAVGEHGYVTSGSDRMRAATRSVTVRGVGKLRARREFDSEQGAGIVLLGQEAGRQQRGRRQRGCEHAEADEQRNHAVPDGPADDAAVGLHHTAFALLLWG